ncbi:hypothetical protein CDAR_442711 [Caerostris darwini]|uniref:Uncharacterized protein n=1 Tax=Caerostris darwini TaxID=1538125 RepID=A0AAV4VNQ9_9ARAC|nr:hypothetical protein CDAR_442711 [Caerostris darwini]
MHFFSKNITAIIAISLKRYRDESQGEKKALRTLSANTTESVLQSIRTQSMAEDIKLSFRECILENSDTISSSRSRKRREIISTQLLQLPRMLENGGFNDDTER